MRIAKIFWISISLTVTVLIGYSVINFDHNAVGSSEGKKDPYSLSNTPKQDIPNSIGLNESYYKIPPQHLGMDNPQEKSISTDIPKNEQTTLASGEKLLEANNIEEYERLRKEWQGKEKEISRWVFLDAQALILDGKTQDAVKLLESSHFKGKDESDRLVRLAGLSIIENPQQALVYLSDAVQNEPQNPDLHLFKASLSEALKQNRLAGGAYLSAVKQDSDNPHRREMLADFYLRSRQFPQALAILEDTLQPPSLDSIWLKTAFWNRMAIPVHTQWKEQDIPPGSLKNLAGYILALPPGVYWNEQTFAQLSDKKNYLSQQQETFWLQLLSALKNGQEKNALTLLLENPFQNDSWAPDLEKGLKALLHYRLFQKENGSQTLASLLPLNGNAETPMQLLQLLAALSETPPEQLHSAIPYQLHDFLLGEEAFVIPFLAIEWTEAALQLHRLKKIPENYPQWVAVSLAKAIKQNRDSKTALSFALEQPTSNALSLVLAELALETGEERLAFDTLKEIYTKNDESGKRAALILGQFLAEHNNPEDAKKALTAQPSLAEEPAAKEILARIALQQGDQNGAHSLYMQIEKESSEAKSFLAKKAFADKDWTKARILTESLLKNYPGNPQLEENLTRIKVEEQKLKQ